MHKYSVVHDMKPKVGRNIPTSVIEIWTKLETSSPYAVTNKYMKIYSKQCAL